MGVPGQIPHPPDQGSRRCVNLLSHASKHPCAVEPFPVQPAEHPLSCACHNTALLRVASVLFGQSQLPVCEQGHKWVLLW